MKGFVKCIIYLAVLGGLSFFAGRIVPKKWFNYDRFPYRLFRFEEDGKLYHNIGIRKWKNKFPDMSVILPKLMPSKRLPETIDAAHIELMVQETCVAEGTHFLISVLGFGCVLLWKSLGGWIVAILYALGNTPYVLIQRHNRPKLIRILNRLQESESIYAYSRTEHINEKNYHSELQYRTRT